MKKRSFGVAIVGLFAIMFLAVGPAHALIGPDQDLSDFPPWIWPIILPVSAFANAVTDLDVSFDQAAKNVQEAVFMQCKCFTAGDYTFKELLTMVDAQFTMQLATLNFARTKTIGLGMGDMVMYDDDDWCGTPPKPRPWPPYLLDLVKVQIEVFKAELPSLFKLNRTEVSLLNAALNAHYKDFALALE